MAVGQLFGLVYIIPYRQSSMKPKKLMILWRVRTRLHVLSVPLLRTKLLPGHKSFGFLLNKGAADVVQNIPQSTMKFLLIVVHA